MLNYEVYYWPQLHVHECNAHDATDHVCYGDVLELLGIPRNSKLSGNLFRKGSITFNLVWWVEMKLM